MSSVAVVGSGISGISRLCEPSGAISKRSAAVEDPDVGSKPVAPPDAASSQSSANPTALRMDPPRAADPGRAARGGFGSEALALERDFRRPGWGAGYACGARAIRSASITASFFLSILPQSVNGSSPSR